MTNEDATQNENRMDETKFYPSVIPQEDIYQSEIQVYRTVLGPMMLYHSEFCTSKTQ